MKLNEVLDIAIMYLNLSDELNVTGAVRTPVNNKKLKSLLRCANVVYSEIASDYMPLKDSITLNVSENKVSYQSFPRRVIDVVKVIIDGVNVKYIMYPNYLRVEAQGNVEIDYHYLPEDIALDDELDYSVKLAPTTFAAGIAAEYALINNMYEEAVAFERKFREGLRSNSTVKKSQHIKGRRWN